MLAARQEIERGWLKDELKNLRDRSRAPPRRYFGRFVFGSQDNRSIRWARVSGDDWEAMR